MYSPDLVNSRLFNDFFRQEVSFLEVLRARRCLDLSVQYLFFTAEYFHCQIISVLFSIFAERCLFYQWEALMVAFVKIMLVPFKYLKHQQTGVILDSLKFYFAIFEVQKPRRKMETAELGAGRAESMVLMLKN